MNESQIEIGKLVREYRLVKNLTQKNLADRLGYESVQFISLFERGLAKVPTEVLGKLIVILDIPEEKLVGILVRTYFQLVTSELSLGKRNAGEPND